MLIFTPDGKTVLVANEAEPSDDYQIDPEGSIGIVDVSDLSKPTVRFAGFRAWNGKEQELRQKGVRIYGPNASAAQDLEPEYIAVSADGTTAWATLQENNALAKIDIASATVTDLLPLGYKDHGLLENALDTNDEDGTINIRNFPGLRGLYLPDAIKSYTAAGNTYLVLANEGDARAWGEDNAAYWQGDASKGFVEEFRVKHLVHTSGFARRQGDDLPPQLAQLAAGALLNPATFGWCGAAAGSPGTCRDDNVLGRLNITWTMGYRQNADGTPVKFNKSGVQDNAGDRLMYDNCTATAPVRSRSATPTASWCSTRPISSSACSPATAACSARNATSPARISSTAATTKAMPRTAAATPRAPSPKAWRSAPSGARPSRSSASSAWAA